MKQDGLGKKTELSQTVKEALRIIRPEDKKTKTSRLSKKDKQKLSALNAVIENLEEAGRLFDKRFKTKDGIRYVDESEDLKQKREKNNKQLKHLIKEAERIWGIKTIPDEQRDGQEPLQKDLPY
jgi:hypothetical protein